MAFRMNKQVIALLDDMRAAHADLADWQQNLQIDWDDATERWQESERGQAVQEWLTGLENSLSEMDTVIGDLDGAEMPE